MKKLNDQLLDSEIASGHFVLASGNHAAQKFEFDNVARKRRLLRRSARGLFDLAVEAPEFDEFDTFLTVGNGANCLARGLRKRSVKMKKRTIEVKLSTYSIKNDEKEFRVIDDNDHMHGRRIMLVDDAYNHGTNMGKLSQVVEALGGTIVGAVAILDRSQEMGVQTMLLLPGSRRSVPVLSLIRRPMDDWDPADCRAEMLSRNYDPSLCSVTSTAD